MSKPIPLLLIAAAAAAALGLAAVQARLGDQAEAPEIDGNLLPAPRPIAPFRLSDQDGSPFTDADLRGVWTFVFLGFSHCPDACPTTLAKLAAAEPSLAEHGLDEDTAYRFVSVDPRRDSLDRLAAYTAGFGTRLRGATGDEAELRSLAASLATHFQRGAAGKDGDYPVEHGTRLLLVDPQARLHAVLDGGATPQGLVEDYARIRAHSAATR